MLKKGFMTSVFTGKFVDSSYEGQGGWVEETALETEDYSRLEDKIRPFLNKKVKVTIVEIE